MNFGSCMFGSSDQVSTQDLADPGDLRTIIHNCGCSVRTSGGSSSQRMRIVGRTVLRFFVDGWNVELRFKQQLQTKTVDRTHEF